MSILAPTDLSEHARAGLRSAARLALRRETALQVMYCDESYATDAAWRPFVETPWEDRTARRRQVHRRLDGYLADVLGELGDALEIATEVRFERVDAAIADRESAGEVELVVAGATGASALSETLFGSTAEEIVRTAEAPVLIVPHERKFDDPETILAPIDLSDCSRASLRKAIAIAREFGAELHVVRAIDLPTAAAAPHGEVPSVDMEGYREQMQRGLEEFLEEFDLDGLDVSTDLPVDAPHAAIVEAAERLGADLVVMGTHGRRGVRRLLLGSTTIKVLRRVAVPILTVRHRE